jgi:hypothetical protein
MSELKMRTTTMCFTVTVYREIQIQIPLELNDTQAAAAIKREYKWMQIPQWVRDARDAMYSHGDLDWDSPIEVNT